MSMLALCIALAFPAYAQDDDADVADEGEEEELFLGAWKDRPIDPKTLLDLGAYTIGQNRVRISPSRVDYGILDNIEIGTDLILDVFEIYNARMKVAAVQLNRLDASFQAGRMYYDLARYSNDIQEARASITSLAWRSSVVASKRLGFHGGQTWYVTEVHGDFKLQAVAERLAKVFGTDIGEELAGSIDGGKAIYGGGQIIVSQVFIASDIRLNRRDSIVIQAHAVWRAFGRIDAGTDVQTSSDADITLGAAARFNLDLQQSKGVDIVVPISWQFNWENFVLRAGWNVYKGATDSNTALYIGATQALNAYWIF